jgi:hypothetical protein
MIFFFENLRKKSEKSLAAQDMTLKAAKRNWINYTRAQGEALHVGEQVRNSPEMCICSDSISFLISKLPDVLSVVARGLLEGAQTKSERRNGMSRSWR